MPKRCAARLLIYALTAMLAVAGLIFVMGGARAESLMTIAPHPGVILRALVLEPAGQFAATPRGTLVLFAGGNGRLGIKADGTFKKLKGNFLVRNRARFAAKSYAVAVPDMASDFEEWGDDFRLSPEHAADIGALIQRLRREHPGPLWLVGTSRGTLSAVNGAARLKREGPDGIVLTATVTRQSKSGKPSVHDAALGDIAVPVLLHHRDDGCSVTPWADQAALAKALTAAPLAEAIAVEGGESGNGKPCQGSSRHGFLGLDDQVVAIITDWFASYNSR